jgi:hypothetical protein
MRKCFTSHNHHLVVGLWINLMIFIITLFDKVGELFEVEESVADSLSILLLIDEIMSLNLLVSHLLLLVLTHHLSKGAIELPHVIRKQLSVAENLEKKFLLVFFANEATLDSDSLVCHLFPTVVENLLRPNASLFLFLEALYLHVTLTKSEFANLAMHTWIINLVSLKQRLILDVELMRLSLLNDWNSLA